MRAAGHGCPHFSDNCMKNQFRTVIVALFILGLGYLFMATKSSKDTAGRVVEPQVADAGASELKSLHGGEGGEKIMDRIKKAVNPYPEFPLDTPDRQEWIRNFPFSPTYSEKDFFEASKYYGPNGDFFGQDMKHVEKAYRHGFMRYFYENPSRFSRPFEEIYKILKSEGIEDNPMATALIFNDMMSYYRANEMDPNEIWDENDVDYEVEILPDGREKVKMVRKPRTYSDLMGDLYEMVSGKFLRSQYWEGMDRVSEERARAIRDRLFTEVDGSGFIEARWHAFAYHQNYENELKDGDPMLIK